MMSIRRLSRNENSVSLKKVNGWIDPPNEKETWAVYCKTFGALALIRLEQQNQVKYEI